MKHNILITGANGTLGNEIKTVFTADGYRVYTHSLNGKANFKADFNKIKTLNHIKSVIEKNDITCIINNAGLYSNTEFTLLSDTDICKLVTVNLIAPIVLTKYLYNYVVKNKKQGLIVNINSLAGKHPNYMEAVYCASKFGLGGFGSCLSTNQQQSNISVMDCYFGGIKTNMTANRHNYNTLIEPKEVAEVILTNINNNKTGILTSFEYRKNYGN